MKITVTREELKTLILPMIGGLLEQRGRSLNDAYWLGRQFKSVYKILVKANLDTTDAEEELRRVYGEFKEDKNDNEVSRGDKEKYSLFKKGHRDMFTEEVTIDLANFKEIQLELLEAAGFNLNAGDLMVLDRFIKVKAYTPEEELA